MPPPAHIDTTPSVQVAAGQLVEHGDDHAGAGGGDRVAEAAAAAVDVEDVVVDAEGAAGGDRHRAERLVDLEQVDVVDAQPGPGEGLRDGVDGAPCRCAAGVDADRRPTSGCGPAACRPWAAA